MYKLLKPEVGTEETEDTIMDASVHPPKVDKLAVRFEVWLGDDLLAMFPCFLVTERLKIALEKAGLSGYSFDEVAVSRSPDFDDLYPGLDLPKFYWMKVVGKAGQEDFGLSDEYYLVVSERAFELLSLFQIDHCDVEEFR